MKSFQTLSCNDGCLVRSNSIFKHLTPDELEKVTFDKSTEQYKRGSIIYREGSRINGCYCLQKGIIKVYKTGIDGKEQIIGGLTYQVIERLQKIHAVTSHGKGKRHFTLNTDELKIELDRLVVENRVTPHLHTLYSAPQMEGNRVTAVFMENKNGRQAIRARVFVDATGDGDLAKAAAECVKACQKARYNVLAVVNESPDGNHKLFAVHPVVVAKELAVNLFGEKGEEVI